MKTPLFTTCVTDIEGKHSITTLISSSHQLAAKINAYGIKKGDRIAFITPPGSNYTKCILAIWVCGAIAVPLCTTHPSIELEYTLKNCGASLVLTHPFFESIIKPLTEKLGIQNLDSNAGIPNTEFKEIENDDALLLYTSGSTGKPKGVLHTHRSLQATIQSMIETWEWTESDHILNVLPLHHTHGLINALLTPMYAGATIEFIEKFSAEAVWDKFLEERINVFMAVPTIYTQLIHYWQNSSTSDQQKMTAACKKMRLMVSGSAALPIPTLEQWERISGHRLLERYGMTEIGMAITNPLHKERRPGCIGQPFTGVSIQLDKETEEANSGEILVKGPTVFKKYWNNPKATNASFVDGWFKTGDIATISDGYFKILGRNSVDIIKSGGYKVSALEIENVLREYHSIRDCAVVGIPSEEWGEVIAAALVTDKELKINELTLWLKNKLAPYKLPRVFKIASQLPKNAMGKVLKKEVKQMFKPTPNSR